MSLKKQAVSGLFWTSILQFSTQGIGFFVSIFLARFLTPEEFGLIGMIGVFISIGIVLIEGGLGQSLIRMLKPTNEDYTTVFYFNLLVSILIYLSIFMLSPYISEIYNQPILEKIIKWYCLIFIINAFSSIQYTRLTKQMHFKKELIITIPSLILSSFVGIFMAYNGYGVWSLVVSAIIQSATLAIQLWFWSDWKPTFNFSINRFKYHFEYGYKLTLSGILDAVFNNAYAIVIGKFFAPAQVGFYNRADGLKQFPVNNVSTIINKITLPLFAEIQNDDLRLKDVYKKIMQMVVFFVSPILLISMALAEPLFRLLFTEKWLPAVPYYQILCWNGILYPIHAYNLNILKIKGRSDLFLKIEIIKKTTVALVIVLTISYGITGLLYGSVFLSFFALFVNTHYSGKFIGYSLLNQIKDIFPTIFLASITAVLVYCFDFFLKQQIENDSIRLILGSLFGMALFGLIAYICKMNSISELIKIIQNQ